MFKYSVYISAGVIMAISKSLDRLDSNETVFPLASQSSRNRTIRQYIEDNARILNIIQRLEMSKCVIQVMWSAINFDHKMFYCGDPAKYINPSTGVHHTSSFVNIQNSNIRNRRYTQISDDLFQIVDFVCISASFLHSYLIACST